MLRSIAKDAAAQLAAWTRLDAVAHDPYIIGYHRVVERLDAHRKFALPSMEISVAMLEKHLDWLGTNFEIVSLDDFSIERRPRSKPRAVVTFDDGYGDAFHNAFPMLKRKGIPAAFFVVTDLIGTDDAPIHDRLYAALFKAGRENAFSETQDLLRNQQHAELLRIIESTEISRQMPSALHPLTWEMLRKMRDAGMTIGSHSKTHAFLTNETPQRVRNEVHGSREVLQQRLGIKADCFAYPGGDFNASVIDAVHAAGYRLAFTVCRHRDARYPMLTIQRRGLWERSCIVRFGRFSPQIMSAHAAAIFGRTADCPDSH